MSAPIVPPAPPLVVDHDRLAQLRLQLRRERTRERVGPAARRERHHEADRPGGPRLGLRLAGRPGFQEERRGDERRVREAD